MQLINEVQRKLKFDFYCYFLNVGGQQVILVTTTGGIRTVQGTATVQAGGAAGTQTVNVLPTTGQVTTGPGGVKMIVVSQGSASAVTSSTSATAAGTKTISIPAGALQKTVTLARTGAGSQNQLITLPGGTGQQTITLGGKPVTVQVSTASGQKTVTLVTNQGAFIY